MLLPLSPQRIKGQNVSVISLHFAFHRQFGFYVLQIYVPLTLIVMCSWVTFWLRKTEKGRTGLRSFNSSYVPNCFTYRDGL